ncbi:MAG TPA: aspartate aminotransferase family protein [Candidatus Acidoferrales bacterium]|nr:aspartate aminotransferase family protein [Candidatus Acidoferrales bacterium]
MKKPIQQPQNQKPFVHTAIPGPKSRELRKREDEHLAPGLQSFALMAGIAVKEARGSVIIDADDNNLIDIIGGIGVNGLGHSHPAYVQAVQSQIAKASVGSFTSQPRVELFERLAKHRPSSSLHRVQLYSSGAEAVESALRLAKSYTGKYEFVSFSGGFHGKTMGALSLMGSEFKNPFGPMVPGSHIAPYADCYRCPLKLNYPSCGLACVEATRQQIKQNSSGKVAAFLIEPMQGTAGNVIPPKEFLPAIKEVAREFDALLIVDEMITGFGRTGEYWGVEHSGVTPDIVTLGKQFAGGFPISGILSTDDIVKAEPWSNPSGSSSSYGGNPLAAAAANACLKIIDEEGLVENSRRVGEYFLKKVEDWVDRYPFVGHVHGAGLFIGMDLVRDKASKEPISKISCRRIFHECLQRGLLAMTYSPRIRIQPALTIDEGTVDSALTILAEVFDLIAGEGCWQ